MNDAADDLRLRWYPQRWRARYGDELVALLDDEYGDHLPVAVRLSLVSGGLRQRARQSGLVGDSASPADGVRAGALLVLAAWTLFVIAGASFAKFSEHFDEALPHGLGAHRLPDDAFTVFQTTAGVASLLVIVGAVVALPVFVQFLRAGNWGVVRRPFFRALRSTLLTALLTVPLLVWAHHLTPQQRNGGIHWYGVMVLIWAGLLAVTLVLWTLVAVAAARRVDFPRSILTAEATLAVAIALAMVAMVAATAVWWGAMANDAPTFLSASPGGARSSPWDIWLILTVALMITAMCTAAVGVVREVNAWARMRTA